MICEICAKEARHFRAKLVRLPDGRIVVAGTLHYCDEHVREHPIGRIEK
jgi:hypothetical protein